MSEKNEFEYSEKMNYIDAAEYIIKLASGLRERKLKLQGKGRSIVLTPEEIVKLEVKAERKDGKGEIEIELSWKEGYLVNAEKLEISSEAEEVAETD